MKIVAFLQNSNFNNDDTHFTQVTNIPPTPPAPLRTTTTTTTLQVVEVVEPLRDQLDAVVVFPSMPEVMRLNKVGSFTMANLGQSKSIVADFMKSKKKQDGSSFEEGMLKLLRTL